MEDGQGVGLASVMNKDGWGRRSVVGSASFDRSLNLILGQSCTLMKRHIMQIR